MRSLFFILAVGATLPFASACHDKAENGQDEKKESGKKESGKKESGKKDSAAGGRRGGRSGAAFAVDVMTVSAEKVPYVVTAPGTIEAFERVQVTSRVSGVVDRVAFSEGQEVQKGDVLVTIDAERFRLALNSAKAALDKSSAGVRDIQAMLARREGVSKENPGVIPGEELETYRTRSLTAKADREVATQALKTSELNLRDSSVRAPIAGVIQTRTIETGQFVQPGYVMATLLRSDPLLLRFQVEPIEAPRLKPGIAVSFTMRETLRKFGAHITLVSGAADPATHMVGVTAQVDNEGHKYWLRPGAFCDVTLDVGAPRAAVIVPRSAARATDHGYVAYIIEGEAAHERVLTLGMSTKDGWVEVRQGLTVGELLVVRGAEALTEGAKVRQNQVTAEQINQAQGQKPGQAKGQPSGQGPAQGPAQGQPPGLQQPPRQGPDKGDAPGLQQPPRPSPETGDAPGRGAAKEPGQPKATGAAP